MSEKKTNRRKKHTLTNEITNTMAHEMMKTDTMQFELILLMRLTRNNNIHKRSDLFRGRQIKLRHIEIKKKIKRERASDS